MEDSETSAAGSQLRASDQTGTSSAQQRRAAQSIAVGDGPRGSAIAGVGAGAAAVGESLIAGPRHHGSSMGTRRTVGRERQDASIRDGGTHWHDWRREAGTKGTDSTQLGDVTCCPSLEVSGAFGAL